MLSFTEGVKSIGIAYSLRLECTPPEHHETCSAETVDLDRNWSDICARLEIE